MTLDLVMPEHDGLHALHGIMEFDSEAKVLVVSALEQRGVLKDAIKAGAADFVAKPFDKRSLQATLEQLVPHDSNSTRFQRKWNIMKVEYINPFLASTISVFDTMLNCKLERGDPYLKNGTQPQHEVSGVIGLSGKAQGTVVLGLSREAALDAAEALLQERRRKSTATSRTPSANW